jgi:hypothetical protein
LKFPSFKFELKFNEAKVVLKFRDLIEIPRDFEKLWNLAEDLSRRHWWILQPSSTRLDICSSGGEWRDADPDGWGQRANDGDPQDAPRESRDPPGGNAMWTRVMLDQWSVIHVRNNINIMNYYIET